MIDFWGRGCFWCKFRDKNFCLNKHKNRGFERRMILTDRVRGNKARHYFTKGFDIKGNICYMGSHCEFFEDKKGKEVVIFS